MTGRWPNGCWRSFELSNNNLIREGLIKVAALCERYASDFDQSAKRTREIKNLILRRILEWWPTGRFSAGPYSPK
jgi:hypothetical protein